MINFVSLCESCLIEEAYTAHLRSIAKQARQWKKAHSKAIEDLIAATRKRSQQDVAQANKQKNLAVQQLIVLQDFLRDEFLDETGQRLPDNEFTKEVMKSSFYPYEEGKAEDGSDDTGGLVFVTPPYIKKLRSM